MTTKKPDPNEKRIWRQSQHTKDGKVKWTTPADAEKAVAAGNAVVYIELGSPIPAGTKRGAIVVEYTIKSGYVKNPIGRIGDSWPDPDHKGQFLYKAPTKYAYYYTSPKGVTLRNTQRYTNSVETITLLKTNSKKFNPPPHKASRTVSPAAFPNLSVSSSVDADTIERLQKVNQRGFFFQDTKNSWTAKGNPKYKASQLWGFQFMYNPTTFGHQQQNANFDISNTQDISNQLTGNQTMSVNLFINRMIDMSALAYDRAKQVDGTGGDYARALTDDDIHGILKRGTEYDLEFLYRVVNGEPKLGPSTDRATSDFGFIAPAPIWFRFHDNLKYKVIINNISVNHIIFTENMVPMVTEVSISMLRIPTPDFGDADSTSFLTERYTSDNTYSTTLPTTGAPSNTGTT